MRLRRLGVAALIAAGAALAAYGLLHAPLLRPIFGPLELTTLDWRMRQRGRVEADSATAVNPRAAESRVRLVLLDSLAASQWPWQSPFPRGHLADVIDHVARQGAAAIALDVYLDRLYPELAGLDADGDARLRDAIARAGNVVLAAPTEGTAERRVLLPPDPYFADVAAAVGTADLGTSLDETLREWVYAVRTERGWVPGFALATWAVARGVALDTLFATAERTGRFELAGLPPRLGRVKPGQAAQTLPVLYHGPPSRTDGGTGAFTAVSSSVVPFLELLHGPDHFRDRIVLIGSGYHYEDRFRTPFFDERGPDGDEYGWMYGVEVHANALENLLRGEYPLPFGAARTAALLFLVALLVGGMTFWRGVGAGAAAVAIAAAAVWALAVVLFDRALLHVPVVAPAFAGLLAFLGSTSYVSIVEGRDKRVLRRAFSKYVPPAVVDELVEDPSRIKLGGERREITILFSDLAGFTTMSESMQPEMLVSLLNEYLDEMADIVMDERGTLDKYIGDAIMTLFGAPAAQPDHALRACRTALRMHRRLEELNADWIRRGVRVPSLHMRIGINTGAPVVGNIGGEQRFDYTALGDPVNLAARLEPACKSYGVRTMISEATRAQAGPALVVRELELLAVYGKREPVPVYELVALAGEELGEKAEVLAQYAAGLRAFRDRDFELALQYFRAALEIDAADGPSRLYAERCEQYMLEPPPVDWDFVERRSVK